MAVVPASLPSSPPCAWQPDVQRGVFETLLVLDGRPVELDAHLARLQASLAELFPARKPPPLDLPVERGPYGPRSTGTSARALRIAVAPGGGGELEVGIEPREVACVAFVPLSRTKATQAALASLTLSGGLGAHKWADRSLLDRAQAELPENSLPLLVDEDGAVLEASRASVFAVRGGALFTPPLDGRILPGTTRARVLEIAAGIGIETHETPLTRGDLHAADEVLLTGSVRGVERAGMIDGATLRGGGEVTERIAAELWRVWTSAPAAAVSAPG